MSTAEHNHIEYDGIQETDDINPVDRLQSVYADIKNMLARLTTVDEHVYTELMWSGEVKTLSIEYLESQSKLIQKAIEDIKAERYITPNIRHVLLLMCIADIKMSYRLFARIYNRYYESAKTKSHYREKFVKLLERIDWLRNSEEELVFEESPRPANEFSAIELEIEKVLNTRIEAFVKPVNMLVDLMTNDLQLMQTNSKSVTRIIQRQTQALLRTTRRTRDSSQKLFLQRLTECHEVIEGLSTDLKNVRLEKQQAVRSLNKELKNTREMVVKLQKSDPLSELLGIDVNSDKDKQIAELSLKLENMEAKNSDLQRENSRLMKKVSLLEFSDTKE
ncbi:hypothetical protein [Pseudoalteromonas sp.]|uniref:hypothetical protein n=1 Tax=Pseudoalteromonas sp. TaxID=53249 RepID=UPI002625CB31|nr:hypothetical protein [Pseudoalteromonas sp.]MCP3865857.1 hypothetical protein [Aestuariibacter sp.]MCP4237087.1 hypothetical protein [Aestuariibacter sp.]MCP4588918.1 hypothetical protein [Pseudoalteromonas sp.]